MSRRFSSLFGTAAMALTVGSLTPAAMAQATANTPGAPIGRTVDQSTPSWPKVIDAAPGSPNILVWMIDDMGFGQLGCFGGLTDTPNIDRIAAAGLRYANYHSTPVCSASRAAFLTGRNSHTAHIGGHSFVAAPFPGYDAHIPRDEGTIADNFRAAGYRTFAIGKWDHLPAQDTSQAGPFTYWPSGQGFDRYYGFLSADASNFAPVLWSDQAPVVLPKDPAYHLTTDLADKAIAMIDGRDGGAKRPPFFLYWATGAVHAPHHAPDAYLQRYRGRFDMGWDKAREMILARQKKLGLVPQDATLPPRPEGMPAWDSLTADQKRSYARAMEGFAAQLTHADAEFGRIVETLRARGELDNTIIAITADNGASAEGAADGTFNENMFLNGYLPSLADNLKHLDAWGTRETYPHYPMGWAVAGNTPFRYYKVTTYEGGMHVPLIVSWPREMKDPGAIRRQFVHVSDLTPTLLAGAKVAAAAQVHGEPQRPFDGVDLSFTFNDGKSASPKVDQYFEMFGNRAIWSKGWKAVLPYNLKPWNFLKLPPISEEGWELYDLNKDINEQHDLARTEPKRLAEMKALFDREATRFNVFPIMSTSQAQQMRIAHMREELKARNGEWHFTGLSSQMSEGVAPPLHTHSFDLTASIKPTADADGVIFAMGGSSGGMALYLAGGKPVFAVRNFDRSLVKLVGQKALPAGPADIRVKFDRSGPSAQATLLVDGVQVASERLAGPLPTNTYALNETFDIGRDAGEPVSPDYDASRPFDGEIRSLSVRVSEPQK